MALIEIKTNKKKTIKILRVEDEDYKVLTKKRYHFLWKPYKLRTDTEVFKLQIAGNEDILGLMAIIDVPGEDRIEIDLLACSIENVGKSKVYDGVAGHLMAFACREAVKKYGRNACVSLVPKTKIRSHYIQKYGMLDGGRQLFFEGKALNDIILKYLL